MSKHNVLTLNVHCLVEEDLHDKQQRIAQAIIDEDVDLVFLQEVAQTATLPLVYDNLKADNYAYTLQQLLQQQGQHYHVLFVPIKASFDRFDEGLAFLSKHPLQEKDTRYISKTRDYQNWKSRKILVAEYEGLYVSTVHFGWSDGNEVFEEQVDLAFKALPQNKTFLLAGDFNILPSTEEYQYIIHKGVHDLMVGSIHEHHPTHKDNMDVHTTGSRIDYIMSNKPLKTSNHKILFWDNPVSDHYGVFMTIEL